ncbi:anthranilate synthase component I [Mastigocladopsis repens]|uniref:anthranilate synthase component I n=1 Tax=Mastigocladopsis repens TaxID=221287 RepID=UPI000380F4BB|nr:anthranilate synthase component I [Mastigocladopsis repens]
MTKPWYWRSLPLENRTGSDVFAALFRHTSTSSPKIATLLESPYPTSLDRPQLTRYSICAGAPRIVDGVVQIWTPPLGQVLPFLEQLLRGQEGICSPHSPHLPFTGGWLGWLGYDIAWEIEQLPRYKSENLPFPVAFWYEPECFAILDHWEQVLWLAATNPVGLDKLEKKLEQGQQDKETIYPPLSSSPPSVLLTPHLWTSQQEYEAAVNRAKTYIQAGDIFQANLSVRFEAQTTASGWEIYRALQQINPSPFASYWQTPWGEVMSCSPERLVQLQKCPDETFRVSTRPIAGTRSRGVTPKDDQQLAQDLLSSTKERAEHIMLVDLERNDLGRVCEWGTVAVDELLTIERYSHVMHLVSNIKGSLKSDCNALDLIRAMFPGGTITGCPKVRCMEIIEELEPMRRSLFYGSCGYLDWRGNLDLNILIRTLLLAPSTKTDKGTRKTTRNSRVFPHLTSSHSLTGATSYSQLNTVWGQVGAGIVADSDPEREWYESLHKAQAQLKALTMVITQK